MTATKSKPVSWAKLREEIHRLGITEASAGRPLDDLIRAVREMEDPLAFLATLAPPETAPQIPNPQSPIPNPQSQIPDPPARRLRTVSIEIPILDPTEAMYNGRAHVNRHLDARVARPLGVAYRCIFDALHEQGARLKDGRYVNSYADAMRWLLERVRDKMDGE